MYSIPNILTTSRALFALAIIGLFFSSLPFKYPLIFFLFVLATLSDYLDGYLARRFHSTSDFGAIFDPLFDKILVFSVMILLYPLEIIPPLIIILLILRDITTDALRNYALAHGTVIPAIYSAKLKTTAQMLMLALALAHLAWPTFPQLRTLAGAVAIAALIFSLWSGAIYVQRFMKLKTRSATASSQ